MTKREEHFSYEFTERQFATVRAALHVYAATGRHTDRADDVFVLASDSGKLKPLSADELDDLCERFGS